MLRRNILIIRQDRIGDCVLATCLPRELKARWPGCRVTILVRSGTRAVFEHNPHIDEILVDDWDDPERAPTFRTMVGRLWKRRFTHALMLLPQARYNYMTFCAGIPVRVGHGIILFHALTFVRPVMTRKFRKGRHEADYALDLARAIGVRSQDRRPEIHLSGQEAEAAASRRDRWTGGGDGRPARLVGLHATNGKSAPNWEPQNWADLAKILVKTQGVRVVLTDPQPPPALATVPGVVRPPRPDGLRDGLVDLAALDVLVSSSTGPMHAAAALGVGTVSLFCPLPSSEPALWGPLGNRAEHLLPRADYCRDRCPGDPRDCTYEGPSGVDPQAVADRILSYLK